MHALFVILITRLGRLGRMTNMDNTEWYMLLGKIKYFPNFLHHSCLRVRTAPNCTEPEIGRS